MTEQGITIEISDESGLHARPAAELVETVNGYDCDVWIVSSDNGDSVNAASMMAVTGLNLQAGDSLQIKSSGPEASAALSAIEELFSK